MKAKGRTLLMGKFAALAVLLFGSFVSWFVFSQSVKSSHRRIQTPVPEHVVLTSSINAVLVPTPPRGSCDLSRGNWVPDPSSHLLYTNSCSFIQSNQNCISNGRPDSGYLYWRWSPRECELPRLDARRFLGIMRDKSLALVGDSISRNHAQSLLCILSSVEEPRETYHDDEYKSMRWLFHSHNFSLSIVWSPFLMKAAVFEDNHGVSSSEVELHLDRLDTKWTSAFPTWDYVVISTGAWYSKYSVYFENDLAVGCHRCDRSRRNVTDMGFDYAYRISLSRVFKFITKSGHRGQVFYRTSSPDHFENAEWNHGGTCERTEPSREDEVELKALGRMLHETELEEFERAAEEANRNGINLKLLDVMSLSLMRPDGHPGPYMRSHPFEKGKDARVQNDCLHWCLPGPIDTWNDVMMQILQT
ncbi:hypothetical protein MLD38_022367 [Melastoma candidum]|uniref:Uncharacterized protein n=1 Tax=Melastoma candidum TaxID=119954 RepID=A0ACB9QJ31_9MYRT|nr:hypothetical protein MLD38_022367 [Melastoma candidum]